MAGLTPSEALDLKRELWQWMGSPSAHYFFEYWIEAVHQTSPHPIPGHAQGALIARTLADAAVFVVAEDMQAVATHSAQSMPRQEFLRTDLPTPSGMMLFEHPLMIDGVDGSILGLSWHTSDATGEENAFFTFWERLDDTAAEFQYEMGRLGVRLPRLYPRGSMAVAFGRPFGDGRHDLPVIVAMWTLMQQPLASSERIQPDRAASRRAARAGMPEQSISVIRLRRVTSPHSAEPSARDYSVRWIVRGHWRNQYLPSRQTHRLQWITEHVKGPEDKPLKLTEKVYSWQR